MDASKIIVVQAQSGLVGGGCQSRKLVISIEVEGAVADGLIGGNLRIARVREDSGRWVKYSTWLRRIKALGCSPKQISDAGAGAHLPLWRE